MDFEQIRWKPADMLSVDEMDLIRENKDKLSDEEKGAFSYFLDEDEDPAATTITPDTTVQDDPAPAGDDDATVTPPAADAIVVPDATPAVPEVPAFKTQAELDAHIAKTVADIQEKAKRDSRPLPEKPPAFDPTYKPKTVEEMYQQFNERREKELAATTAERERQQREIDTRLDTELKALSDGGRIPKIETPEGKKAVAQMATLAEKYKFNSFTDAYDLWSKIPEEHGGGLKITGGNPQGQTPDQKKQTLQAQKDRASRVNGGTGDGAPAKPKLKYDQMKSMHIDDIVDFALQNT